MGAKFKMVSDGKATYIELAGKTIGTGVKEIVFSQQEDKGAKLELSLDLENFDYMENGLLNKVEELLERK